jgi:large subunit ribosomal protein L21
MYAILKHGGHQYRVAAGDRLLVDRLAAAVGSQVTLEPVLLVADGDNADVGAGTVAEARVVATVVAHRRGRKLRVFTYKPKKRHRRTLGYRSQLTELLVDEVASGTSAPSKRRAEKPTAKPRATEHAARAAEAASTSESGPATEAPPASGAAPAPRAAPAADTAPATEPSRRSSRRPRAEGPAEAESAAPASGTPAAPKPAKGAAPAKRGGRARTKPDGS